MIPDNRVIYTSKILEAHQNLCGQLVEIKGSGGSALRCSKCGITMKKGENMSAIFNLKGYEIELL